MFSPYVQTDGLHLTLYIVICYYACVCVMFSPNNMSYVSLYVSGVSHKHVFTRSLRTHFSHAVNLIVQPQCAATVLHLFILVVVGVVFTSITIHYFSYH